VAIISIDGLRPDALLQAGAPNIMALAARGAYSWRARTIMPSSTLPSHVSMLSGYGPEVHRITWDEYRPDAGQITVPTLFTVARASGLRAVMVAGKQKFAHFRDAGCDAWTLGTRGDDDVAGQAAGQAFSGVNLLFVHLPGVDDAGHASQWMSEAYLSAVRRADQAVGRIVAALPGDTTIIVTADHGGQASGHGSDDPLDITIPWVVAGPTTRKGHAIASVVRTVDTAATAAYLLGVQLSPTASGRPVLEAFAPAPAGARAGLGLSAPPPALFQRSVP
jgi:hypothetical protein